MLLFSKTVGNWDFATPPNTNNNATLHKNSGKLGFRFSAEHPQSYYSFWQVYQKSGEELPPVIFLKRPLIRSRIGILKDVFTGECFRSFRYLDMKNAADLFQNLRRSRCLFDIIFSSLCSHTPYQWQPKPRYSPRCAYCGVYRPLRRTPHDAQSAGNKGFLRGSSL